VVKYLRVFRHVGFFVCLIEMSSVNDHEIRSAYDPRRMIGQDGPGSEVTLSIERGRQVTDVAVVLGQR
jgi:hypothetical protein